jgi:RNA polymerase sigma-70 factor, ECF subfamily
LHFGGKCGQSSENHPHSFSNEEITMNSANSAVLTSSHRAERGSTRVDTIVAAAQAGSPGAFAELYSIYSPRLYRTILGITKSPEDAEDALQDTFLHASLALHAFEGRASIHSWLTRIAINSALMILRKRRIRAEILFDPQPSDRTEVFCIEIKDPAPNPEEVCDFRQRRMVLLQAIRSLNARLREPIRMRMAKGSSLKEISQSLKISEGAVKARLHRARMRLFATSLKL